MKINTQLITIIFIVITAIGCNSVPNKSITDPLSPEELSEIFEKDTSFKATYEFIEISNKFFLNTDVKKAEFHNLTYRSFHDFFKIANNKSKRYQQLDSLFKSDWEKNVEYFQPKIDSTSNYWKEFYSDKKINEYVVTEFAEIVKYIKYGNVDRFGIKFLIIPTRNYELEKVIISYKIQSSILTKDRVYEEILGISQVYSLYKFQINKSIKKSEFIEIPITRNNRDIFYELYPDGLKYDDDVVLSIDEIVVNGKIIKNQANIIPYEVKNYWIESLKEPLDYQNQFIITQFVREFFDKNFEYQFEYSQRKIKEYLEDKDPLSSKYFFEVVEQTSKLNN